MVKQLFIFPCPVQAVFYATLKALSCMILSQPLILQHYSKSFKENMVKKHRQIEKTKKVKQFEEIFIKIGIKPEFLTDTVKESLMIEVYSSFDQD